MDIISTLLNPGVLFFALGFVAVLLKSNLTIPESVVKFISLYLMLSIGFKGGTSLFESSQSTLFGDGLIIIGIILMMSAIVPIYTFYLLHKKIGTADAAGIGATYGSNSTLTYITAVGFLASIDVPYEGYMTVALVVMETPAIVVGLNLASRYGETVQQDSSELARETLLNGSVVLLTGSFFIGLLVGKGGFEPVSPVFEAGFYGLLCVFLLDMGLVAARRLRNSKSITMRLAALAVAMPLINGTVGTVLASLLGFDTGTAATFGVLTASASYIAVPAAMRVALPKADPGLYLTLSLAITFPFNILFGISLFTWLAKALT